MKETEDIPGGEAEVPSPKRSRFTLPAWPRGMRLEVAAAYLGLSPSSLSAAAKAGTAPKPIRITPGRIIWLKDDLDAWLNKQAGRPPHGQETDGSAELDAYFARQAGEKNGADGWDEMPGKRIAPEAVHPRYPWRKKRE